MGVKSLWAILAPTSKAVRLELLEGKVLAIDASIWLYQFLKALRDSHGNMQEDAHLLGFFRRICKLLFWGVRPVFVFDGAAPALKQATMAARRRRKEGNTQDLERTAKQLLSAQLRSAAIAETQGGKASAGFAIPAASKPKRKADPYALPSINDWGAVVQSQAARNANMPEDIRLPLLKEELEDDRTNSAPAAAAAADEDTKILQALYKLHAAGELEGRRRSSSAASNLLTRDMETTLAAFNQFPLEIQHEIVSQLKDRSRQQSHRRLAQMIRESPSALDFSKLQIQNLMTRNFLTQKLHSVSGFAGAGPSNDVRAKRVAGDRTRQYIFVKNEDGSGWRFEAAKPKVDPAAQAAACASSTSQNGPLPVIADEAKPAFPLVGFDRVFHHDDELPEIPILSPVLKSDAQDDEDDEFLPVTAGQLPPDLHNEMLALVPDHFSQTFAAGVEMLHSAIGWATPQLKSALHKTQLKMDAARAQLSDPDAQIHYENLIFWEDFLDKLILRRETTEQRPEVAFASADSVPLSPLRSETPLWQRSSTPDPLISLPIDGQFDAPIVTTTASSKRRKMFLESDDEDEREPISVSPIQHSIVTPEGPITNSNSISSATANPALQQQFPESDPLDPEVSRKQVSQSTVRIESPAKLTLDPIFPMSPITKATIQPATPDLSSSNDEEETFEEVEPLPPFAPIPPEFGISPPKVSSMLGPEEVPVSTSQTAPVLDQEGTHNIDIDFVETVSEIPSAARSSIPPTKDDTSMLQSGPTTNPIFDSLAQQVSLDAQSTKYETHPLHAEIVDEHVIDPRQEIVDAFMATQKAEEAQFMQFMAEVQNKNLETLQQQLQQERVSLNAQMKKQARDADTVTAEMVQETQHLLRLFGIPYVTAPFEAEAQCAWLCDQGLVDGVVTDDSDVFLFGATTVYKNMFNSAKFVEVYSSAEIRNMLQLDRHALIAVAYLLGSDYTEGIHGVGAVTAMEILAEFDTLEEFGTWARAPLAKTDNKLRCKLRRLAANVPSNWPNPAVRAAYLHPVVETHLAPFAWAHPDHEAIKQLLVDKLHWTEQYAEATLGPIIAAVNRVRSGQRQQPTLHAYFNTTLPAARTKAIASARMRSAIEHKRKAVSGSQAEDKRSEEMPNKIRRRVKSTQATQKKRQDINQSTSARNRHRNAQSSSSSSSDSDAFMSDLSSSESCD